MSCFLSLGHMQTLVYDILFDNAKELGARITIAAGEIPYVPGVFQDVRIYMHRRCEVCIEAGGRNFEHCFDPCTFCYFT